MKLFPTISDVFASSTEIYKTLFFPLVTIDLSEMNKGNGRVHFVSIMGNAYPYLIVNEVDYGSNFVKFDWDGVKYAFDDSIFNDEACFTLLEWYNNLEKDYQQNRDRYLKVCSMFDKEHYLVQQEEHWKKVSTDFYIYASMLINYWITRDKYIETGEFRQGYAYQGYNDEINKPVLSLSKTGATTRSNELVGKVCAYYYLRHGEDEIRLNIDRKTNKVIQTFSWT